MREVASSYFKDLFRRDVGEYEGVIRHVSRRLNDDDNETLLRPLEAGEFKYALFQMHPDKAPGPDGLDSAFFKRFWNICGVELFHTRKSRLEKGEFPHT